MRVLATKSRQVKLVIKCSQEEADEFLRRSTKFNYANCSKLYFGIVKALRTVE